MRTRGRGRGRRPARRRSAGWRGILLALGLFLAGGARAAHAQDAHAWHAPGTLVGGHVLPGLAVSAPGVGSDSEAGIGAMIPWADRLWMVGYVADARGQGIGLYEIRDDLSWRLHPASVTGTYANRLVHWESQQVFIGPYAIDAQGRVRTIGALTGERLAATFRHIEDPEHRVYFLTMEGILWEVDVATLNARRVFDLVQELHLPPGAQPHFESGFTAQGRVVVANNTYDANEAAGRRSAGRLAEWPGYEPSGAPRPWTVLEENPFVEVSGKQNPDAGAAFGNAIYALGWDARSPILRVLYGGIWRRYRLPFGSHDWEHNWTTEWMRVREVQTGRYLMDAFGIFYDVPGLLYDGQLFGVRPIASHLRVVPDLVTWRGLLVLGGDQTDNAAGQPQSGPWFGDVDELSAFGAPSGWGAFWRHEAVKDKEPTDPFLITGFGHVTLHLTNEGAEPLRVRVEVDYLGDGSWNRLEVLEVGAGGYQPLVLPAGFQAHWLRLRPLTDGQASAQLFVSR